jgi:ribosomal protein S18 acetylase RimI-like enzyme
MNDRASRLFRLTRNELEAGGAVLGRAFAEYELLRYYFPDETQRRAGADTLALTTVSVCLKYGEAYGTSERMEGVATWLPPEKAHLSGWQIMRSVPASILSRLGRQGAGRMLAYGRYVDQLRRRLVPYPHWYLDMIGVDPPYQGQGFCGRLLRPVLERTDREGMPCYLETNAEKNVAIYQRFGFEVISEDRMPGLELTTFAMLRKAQTGR